MGLHKGMVIGIPSPGIQREGNDRRVYGLVNANPWKPSILPVVKALP